ncbi:MAG: divergent polysaccharide deacetylase family protein [Candidatus Saelkia tenebricola]|nr:divergent polysaccharide deacetylase family protein [Candidatus Saelkia tenebricola]
MRLILKFIVPLILVFLLFNYLLKNYSNEIPKPGDSLEELFSCFGIEEKNLTNNIQEQRQYKNKTYTYIEKEYFISPDFPIQQFHKNINNFLRKKSLALKKQSLKNKEKHFAFEIFFKNILVYKLNLNIKTKGYLVLVIDDWGYSQSVIPYLKEINIPLNISILPGLRYSKTINKIAHDYSHEVLLHLPMQPQKSRKMEKYLEKFTIRDTMSDKEVEKILTNFLLNLSNIKGVNNHMGSLLSKNEEKMSLILKILNEKGFYYLDSKVISDSVAKDCAEKIGIVCFERDVFLDNKLDSDYIKTRIREAIALSQKQGYAIAIGHTKHITLKTIKEMIPEIIENTYPTQLSNLK